MSVKYILRLDDASEYMDYGKWNPYFKLFDKYEIKPIIAVIPFNQDPQMINSDRDNRFWENVRLWNEKGYCIAMHGYDHVYLNQNSGLLNRNPFSEFAGLSLVQQKEKLLKAQNIFESNSLYPEVFIAPGHTFDENTIQALKDVTTVKTISDGYAVRGGFREYGINWIPQQLSFPKSKFCGLWTICIHPETSNHDYFLELEKFVLKKKDKFERVDNILYRNLNIADYFYRYEFKLINHVKKTIKKLIQ
jgi:hypothetical protein